MMGCGKENSKAETPVRYEDPWGPKPFADSARVVAAFADSNARVVVRSAQREGESREYWVVPTRAASLRWIRTDRGSYFPDVALRGRFGLLRGFGRGDEPHLARLLLAQDPTRERALRGAGYNIFLADSAPNVFFEGETGTVPENRGSLSFQLEQLVAVAPCSSGERRLCDPVP